MSLLTRHLFAALPIVFGLHVATAQAAEAEPDADPIQLTWGGTGLTVRPLAEYMLRFRHFEGRDFTQGTSDDFFRHRARLGLDMWWQERVGVFAQVQDVRIWGEETDTLGDFSADGFDLHQGYLAVRPFGGFELRVGRQEIAYENHRLIGTVAWIEQARSFDAFRASYKEGIVRLDGFYAKVADDTAPVDDAVNIDLVAGNLGFHFYDELDLGLVGVLDSGGRGDHAGRRRATFGGLLKGMTTFGLSYEAEGYGQLGRAYGDARYRAFMLAGALGYRFDVTTKPFLQAHAQYLSGDSDPADEVRRSFDQLYATAHKFHGEMDFFLNIPAHTGQAGLLDAGGTVGFAPIDMLDFKARYHHFRTAVEQPNRGRTFGNELDVIGQFKPWKYLSFDVIYGLFVPGEIYEQERGSDLEHFVYSTLHASL